jgi:hypothetical protein
MPAQLRRRRAQSSADDLSRTLLLGVWGLNFGCDVHYSAAYTDHCRNLLSLVDGHSTVQIDRNDIIELVRLVGAGAGQRKSIGQIKGDIRAADPKWMASAADDDSVLASLDFAIRLWLFIRPELDDGTRTLSEVVAGPLPERTARPGTPGHLSHDFCAKSLTRKGGFKIEWTSYLPDHLTFVGKGRLRVFRHVSALQKYARSKERSVCGQGVFLLLSRSSTNAHQFPVPRRLFIRDSTDIVSPIPASKFRDVETDPANR